MLMITTIGPKVRYFITPMFQASLEINAQKGKVKSWPSISKTKDLKSFGQDVINGSAMLDFIKKVESDLYS